MELAEKCQRQLLDQIRNINRENPVSQATEDAYMRTPRALFVSLYREMGSKQWRSVTAENLNEHLAALYADKPLILFGDDDANIVSTISQPSLVLRMLDMLKLEPGHRVFELGAGSGWNAALMGQLVGPAGHVESLEIIPQVAQRTAATIEALGIENVSIIEADGGESYTPETGYDRAIFTAGAYDLPGHFYRNINDRGLLLAVIKTEGGGDTLFLLRRAADHFESIDSMQCAFVEMTGRHRIEGREPICLEELPEWSELKDKEVSRTPFWWGGKGKSSFVWRTWGIRSFLGISEPLFQAFKLKETGGPPYKDHYFGLWDGARQSLVIAKDDLLISYGSTASEEHLMQRLQQWVSLGMPTTASFELQVYPAGFPLTAGAKQWIVRRNESQFLWTLRREADRGAGYDA